MPGAADQARSTNNLKQIALAMINHLSAYKTFPAAYSTSKDGKPLLAGESDAAVSRGEDRCTRNSISTNLGTASTTRH